MGAVGESVVGGSGVMVGARVGLTRWRTAMVGVTAGLKDRGMGLRSGRVARFGLGS